MDPGKLKHSPIFGSPQLKTNMISVEGLEGNSVAPIDRRDMGPLEELGLLFKKSDPTILD